MHTKLCSRLRDNGLHRWEPEGPGYGKGYKKRRETANRQGNVLTAGSENVRYRA